MISIPQFTGFNDHSFGEDSSLDNYELEKKPSISSSVTIANVNALVDEGLDLIEGCQVKAGLRKLKEALRKIEAQENCNIKGDWVTHITCLYYISYALNYLQFKEELLGSNEKLVKIIENYMQKFTSKSEVSVANFKIKAFYAYFLLFTAYRLFHHQEYQKSYIYSKLAHETLIWLFRNAAALTPTSYLTENQKEKVQFGRLILEKALPKINKILQYDSITDLAKNQSFKNIKACISSWKTNSQKKLQEFKVQINKHMTKLNDCQSRNLLGVRSIDKINLQQTKCHKSAKSINDFLEMPKPHFTELLSVSNIISQIHNDQLNRKIQLLICSYYYMGNSLEYWKQELQEGSQFHFKGKFHSRGQEQLKQEQMCQLYYLKAIILTYLYLDSHEDVIGYLIEKYQKKYAGNLIQITEEDSKLQISSSFKLNQMVNPDPVMVYELPKNAYYKLYEQPKKHNFKRIKTDSNQFSHIKDKSHDKSTTRLFKPTKGIDTPKKHKSFSKSQKSLDKFTLTSDKPIKTSFSRKAVSKNQNTLKIITRGMSRKKIRDIRRR